MELIIKINLDNAAFEDNGVIKEARQILRHFVDDTLYLNGLYMDSILEVDGKKLQDSNGNTIGTVEVTE